MDPNQNEQNNSTLDSIKKGVSNVSQKVQQAVQLANKGGKASKTATMAPIIIKVSLIALAVIVATCFVFAIISGIVSLFSPPTYDKTKGELSSYDGVDGSKFYGVRFIYKDQEASVKQISDDYLQLTYNLILDAKNDGLDIVLTLNQEYSQDSNIVLITTEYANLLAETQETQSLSQCASVINHFGLLENEATIVINNIASSLVNNNFTTETQEAIQNKMLESYSAEKYNYYRAVCDNIFLEDYLLAGSADTLQNLEKHNYIGAIYMPRTQVTFTSASFVAVMDENDTTTIEFKYKNGTDITSVIEQQVIDSSWFTDDDFKIYENSSNINITVNQFTAMDDSLDLRKPTPLSKLLADGTYSIAFTNTDGNYLGTNLLQNVNSENYLFVEFNTTASFNFAEYIVDAE